MQGISSSHESAGHDRVVLLGIGVVAVSAAVLSFAALADLGRRAGVAEAMSWLLPVAIDAAAVVATRAWLSPRTPDGARRYARALVVAAVTLSVLGNAGSHLLAAYSQVTPWWAVVLVSAVPPVVLAATAHLAAMLSTSRRQAAVEPDAPATAPTPSPRVVTEPAEASADTTEMKGGEADEGQAGHVGAAGAGRGAGGDQPAGAERELAQRELRLDRNLLQHRDQALEAAASPLAGKSKSRIVVDRLREQGIDFAAAASDEAAAKAAREQVPAAVAWATEQGVEIRTSSGYDAVRREIQRHTPTTEPAGEPRLQVITGGDTTWGKTESAGQSMHVSADAHDSSDSAPLSRPSSSAGPASST